MIIRLKDHKIAYKLIFYFAFALLFLIIVLFNCLTVKASSYSGGLPQPCAPFDSFINYDGYTIEDLQTFYNTRWGSAYPKDFTTNGTFVREYTEIMGAWGEQHYTVVYIPNDDYSYNFVFNNGVVTYETFDTDTDTLTFNLTHYTVVTFSTYRNQYNDPTLNSINWTGSIGLYGSSGNQIATTNMNYYWLPNKPVFVVGVVAFPTGHATQPTNNPNNFINGSNGQPITRPTQPTITNYTWTTYNAPTIDTTSLESLVKSLIDNVVYGFEYLKNNLQGEFSNLINNIESLFNYVVLSLENGFNKVIQSIQDVMTDLYNNFVSLFEPIAVQMSYITEPFDSSTFESQLNNTSAINILNVCENSFDTFKTTFTNVSEPDSYILQLDFNMPSSSFLSSYIVDGEINFNWLIPLKSVYRPLLWILFIAFAFISILTNIGNYLKGFSGGSDG